MKGAYSAGRYELEATGTHSQTSATIHKRPLPFSNIRFNATILKRPLPSGLASPKCLEHQRDNPQNVCAALTREDGSSRTKSKCKAYAPRQLGTLTSEGH